MAAGGLEMAAVATMVLFSLGLVWAMQMLGRRMSYFSASRRKLHTQTQRHFIAAAQLLARARSASSVNKSRSLARDAVIQADQAINLDSRDAASLIVKALALEHLGQSSSAIKVFTIALSPPACRYLSDSEKADALLKRAALHFSSSKGKRGAKAAIEDLHECIKLNDENIRVHELLGLCYERLKMKDEAYQEFKHVLTVNPNSEEAKAGVSRVEQL